MSKAVPFPTDIHDPAALADWLELSAFNADDAEASAGDLERRLNLLNHGRPEEVVGNALTEIDRRTKATGLAYPFVRSSSGSAVTKQANVENGVAYMFCLLLSYRGWKIQRDHLNPWLLFEELSYHAARSYMGEALLFGTSCRTGRSSGKVFETRINELCRHLGEGCGFNGGRTFGAKDGRLDVVAWRPFPDGKTSKVVMFGQCAAGEKWSEKLPAVQPQEFWENWISGHKVSPLLRSFFMPHRVFLHDEWDNRARQGGILFDRCRIAHHAQPSIADSDLVKKLGTCCKQAWGVRLL